MERRTRRDRGLSEPAVRVLTLMLDDPAAAHYGLDLGQRADVLTGTVYPLLQRFEHQGWLESALEPIDPAQAGRPRRRLYRFTPGGAQRAARAIAERETRSARATPRGRTA